MKPIYLDYAATTPIDRRVAQKMQAHLLEDGIFGNPASLHYYGRKAADAVERARAQVAMAINASPDEIIWTSGATESNNLALKGIAQLYKHKAKHIVTMKTEHKAVLDTCMHLEKDGFRVTYLNPEANGVLDSNKLKAALRDDTMLVSIMHVNNETGVIQNINEIANITSEYNILLHIDAAQSIGKMAIDVTQTAIDLLSLSAHKVYGPKGVGALYLRKKPRVRVAPLMHGGGHEQGMRSGTLATHQLVGMGEALDLAQQALVAETKAIALLRARLLQGLKAIKNLRINGDLTNSVPHILNLRFEGMLADAILMNLPSIAASTASACQAKDMAGSHVLRAMGLTQEQVKSSLRLSFGRFTTVEEIDSVIGALQRFFA